MMDETENGMDRENENNPAGEAETASTEERLARAEAEAAEFKDKALRALAEVENVRRRAERDREDGMKFAATGFARDLLSSLDNLRRALSSVPEGQEVDDITKNLLAGVAATERELLSAFEKNGIRRVEPKGEKFDHNFHQAIFEVENTGQPAGTVVEVLQPGYLLHERLLRPAMVGVAKGGAPAQAGSGFEAASSRPGDNLDTRA